MTQILPRRGVTARVSQSYIFFHSVKGREGHLTLLFQKAQTSDNYKQESKKKS